MMIYQPPSMGRFYEPSTYTVHGEIDKIGIRAFKKHHQKVQHFTTILEAKTLSLQIGQPKRNINKVTEETSAMQIVA